MLVNARHKHSLSMDGWTQVRDMKGDKTEFLKYNHTVRATLYNAL